MDSSTKQALIDHIEPYVTALDVMNEVGAHVDIPTLAYQPYDFQQVVALCCGRFITKPRGYMKGTYKLNSKVVPGHYRITLLVAR